MIDILYYDPMTYIFRQYNYLTTITTVSGDTVYYMN